MPVQTCTEDGKPGWKWGDAGHSYTYTAGNEASRNEAKRKAHLQGAAIGKAKADDDPLTDAEYKRRRSASLKQTTTAVAEMEAALAMSGTERVKGISQTEWDAAVLEDQGTEEGA